jgi:ribosomal protein S27E
MNLRAKCTNEKCEFKGIERSNIIGQVLHYGAANDRVKCPGCGSLMTTTKTEDVRSRAQGRGKSPRNLGASGRD